MTFVTGWSGGAIGKSRVDDVLDRAPEIRWFVDRLNEPEPRGGIVQIVAPHGYGKSSLLSALLHKYSFRVHGSDDYSFLEKFHDDEFAKKAASHVSSKPLPAAYVSLESTRDPVRALLTLRGQLHELAMPRFDYVVFVLLRRTRELDLAKVRHLFPAEAADLAFKLADVALDLSEAVPVLPALGKFFGKHFGNAAHQYLRERNVEDDVAAVIVPVVAGHGRPRRPTRG